MGNNAVFVNDEGGPFNADGNLAVQLLFLHNAVQIANRFIRVGEERKAQAKFFLKVHMALHRVAANA